MLGDTWISKSFFCKTISVSNSPLSDDKVEQFHLSDAFDATCRSWEVSATDQFVRGLRLSHPLACRSDMVYLIPNAVALSLETPSGRSLRGSFPSRARNTTRWQGLRHRRTSPRSLRRHIRPIITLSQFSVCRIIPRPRRSAITRPSGVANAR